MGQVSAVTWNKTTLDANHVSSEVFNFLAKNPASTQAFSHLIFPLPNF